jgi:Holliday junction resolvasome RuvABC DNA-binding subunit
MSIKLVDEPDTRTFLERCSTPPERMRREQRFAKMAISVRDAIEALDPEEYTEAIESMGLSQQEITEMCRALEANTKRMKYNNDRAIRYRAR